MVLHAPDVVLLAPGFLGFSRFGNFYYFTDRVVATLRGIIEEALDRSIPVVPCMTLPTDSLAHRQRFLLEYIAKIVDTRLASVARIHLVGHSTGGVDVQLLACDAALGGVAWSADAERLRARIASVVTISAPHHGTGLANGDLARFGENPFKHPTAIIPLAKTLVRLGALLPREVVALAGLQVACPNDLLEFLLQVVRSRDLIGDLRPDRMADVRRDAAPDPRIPVTCFVTATLPRSDAERPSDPFYADIYEMTAAGSVQHRSPAVVRAEARLNDLFAQRRDILIASPTSIAPTSVDLALNDGVVNAARQLLETAEVAGLVVADHADVLGHYDHRDMLIDGPPLNAGLFHSGAGFGDDQFFLLYRRVAAAILKAIRDRS